METVYAQALFQAVKNGTGAKEAVQNLRGTLEAQGRTLLMPRIAKAFMRLAEREIRRSAVSLQVAHAKDGKRAMKEIKAALSEMGVAAADVQVSVDESLVGGWRLEGRERLLDASFKKMLLDMYNRATAA